MKRYDAVIFDLDGTLLDTAEGICRSVAFVIDDLKLPRIDEDVVRSFIGPPIQHSFARVYGLDKEEADRAAAVFRNRYKEHDLLYARPYEGIFETIGILKDAGVSVAVATYKRQDYAEKILIHFGFGNICDAICGADFEGRFTKKDIIDNAITKVTADKSANVVMVGDSDIDAVGANQSGVDFIGVTYGFGFRAPDDVRQYSNVGIAKKPEDILRFVL